MNIKALVMLMAFSPVVAAQAATTYPAPEVVTVSDKGYGGSLERLSDNGLWAVGWGKSADEYYSYPRLYDVKNKKVTYLFDEKTGSDPGMTTANDVTDDGSLVVGSYSGKPSIWRASAGEWVAVENKHSYKSGTIERVTPDGRFAIGTVNTNDGMYATVRVWDLSGDTPKDITPANLPKPIGPNLSPTLGELDSLVRQLYAGDLSADGTKFTGLVNFSCPDDCWSFIYDLTTGTWEGLGMKVTEDGDKYKFERNVSGLCYANAGNFVSGTNTLAGGYHSSEDEDGIYYYDLDTKTVTLMPDGIGYEFGAADPFGTVYASKSYGGPMRDWYFRVGSYWYDFSVVAKQLWNIDWMEQVAQDEIGLTGTFTNVSRDGLTLVVSDYSMSPYNSYVITLPAPFSEIARDVNLLGNYVVTPANNSSFGNLREVKVTFDREIDVTGAYNSVSVADKSGNVIANSISLASDPGDSKTVVATFRNRRLADGESYKVTFPAGIVTVKGDKERKNDEISVTYTGRPSTPVAPVTISPADGTEVARINASSNPVSIRFNSEITATTGDPSGMMLYLLGDNGEKEEIAVLSGSITGDVLSVYPLLEQRLAYGSEYEVVIPAGTVADISGTDPNEAITIHYKGSYVPESAGADGVLFEDDFDLGLSNKWMLYNGASDLEPADLMASWGFKDGYPWWTVMESEESVDQSACTHSMFKNPGQADSWMVTSLLNIKDDTAFLTFKSQSYHDSGDVLKVYVYATDDVYTMLTPTIVENFRKDGDVVYSEVQKPGASDELLSGDWLENTIKLDKYAGKSIYVAFVNDNENKSAIFLDDVLIGMDVKFHLTNLTPTYAVKTDETEVKGLLEVMSLTETFKGYSIVLLDGDGNEVSKISDGSAETSKGWRLEFTFPEKLTTPVGKVTRYHISVTMGDATEVYSASMSNLTHQTTKRVIIEEMTGQGCQACPLGHAAIDWILKDFAGLVYPVEIHTYTGDSFNNARVQGLCTSLGLEAAPTARINRGAEIVSPMEADSNNKYQYKNAGVWYDHVVAELETMAPADIEITSVYNDGDTYTATIDVTYALDMDSQNVNLLLELCEDEVAGVQYNPRHDSDDPALGEWGLGGKYGQLNMPYDYHNVLRNWEGATFNGTGGMIPTNVESGKTYSTRMSVKGPKSISDPNTTHLTALLIDSQSGKALNVARRMTNTAVDGVDEITADYKANVTIGKSFVEVSCEGMARVAVYSIDGMLVNSADGADNVRLEMYGYKGVALVVVETEHGSKSYKALFR